MIWKVRSVGDGKKERKEQGGSEKALGISGGFVAGDGLPSLMRRGGERRGKSGRGRQGGTSHCK